LPVAAQAKNSTPSPPRSVIALSLSIEKHPVRFQKNHKYLGSESEPWEANNGSRPLQFERRGFAGSLPDARKCLPALSSPILADVSLARNHLRPRSRIQPLRNAL
jgi:hypothetical protein